MSASAAQTALFRRIAPLMWADELAQAAFDAEVDDAIAELNLSGIPAAARDRAVVNLALHRIRMQNPNVGGAGAPTAFGEPGGSNRSGSVAHLPLGYPADYYLTPYGQALIGILSTSAALAPQ